MAGAVASRESPEVTMPRPAQSTSPVTMRDVAEHSGVPLSAVSLALNGRAGVAKARRDRVLASAAELGYEHRQRGPSSSATVGLVMEAISRRSAQDGFMAELVSGVEAGLREHGMRMVLHLCHSEEDPLPELRKMLGRSVDGVIFANGGDVDDAMIMRTVRQDVPVVLLENYLQRSAFVHSVVADNFTAGLLGTRHLLDLGHRRIGMIVGSTRYVSLRDRKFGYEAALMEAGFSPEPALMPAQPRGDEMKGYRQARMLMELPDPPTAIYAVSDKSAMGAYRAAADLGLRIPEDFSIVGTDDVHQSQMLSPPLTTYRVPTFEMGRTSAATMHNVLHRAPVAPARTALLGTLVERGSTRSLQA